MVKRILFVATGTRSGGVPRAFNGLAAALEERGWKVGVIFPYREEIAATQIDRKYVLGCAKERLIRNKVLRMLVKAFHALTGWRFFWRGVPRFEHDVIAIYNSGNIMHWSRYSGKPSIAWHHTIIDGERPGWWNVGARFVYAVNRKSMLRFTKHVGVSKEVAETYREYYRLPEMPTVLENIMDCDEIVEKSKEPATGLRKTEKPRLIYAGRFSPEKGCVRLLSALSRLKKEGCDFILTMIGKGPQLHELEECARKNGLSDNVEFLGRKANPYPYIKAALLLLLLPSAKEGFGLVVWEALLLHTPVLVTRCGGAVSAANGGAWARVVDNSEEGVYQGLKEFLSDPAAFSAQYDFSGIEKSIQARLADIKARNIAFVEETAGNRTKIR